MPRQAPSIFGSPIPGSEEPDCTPTYRHPDFVKELKDSMPVAKIKTIWDCFTYSVERFPNAKCHGVRKIGPDGKAGEFVWKTYKEVQERVANFASGVKEFMKPDVTGEMKLLGLMGGNSPEWSTAELACCGMSGTTVPLYTTTTKETLEYLLNQNGCATIVCDTNCAPALIKAKPAIPTLKTLIVFGKEALMDEIKKDAEAAGLSFYKFTDIENKGKENRIEFEPPKPETIYSFLFTSGSTGMPKGALLKHESQMSVIAGAFHNTEAAGIGLQEGGKEFHLSYLPSAHIMERAFQINVLFVGGSVGYFQGIREQLLDDLKTLRPTVWPSVPRLLNLIHDKIWNQVRGSGAKEKIFVKALNAKQAKLKNGVLKSAFWDTLVFNKLKKKLGLDRCKFIITGSAPISGAVLDFYRAAFGCCVIEGYGASETCASASMTHPLHFSSEHVGGPAPNCELRLTSVPQMNYLVTDTEHNKMAVRGRGEILVRGKCLMREYYRNPEATAKAIDSKGWYHTGDVGAILPNGTFKIFDRVGNVFKLSIGEYVAPEKIENMCTRSSYVTSIFVHGDAFHPKLVAIVVPDPDVGALWAKDKGVSGDIKELAKNEDFKKLILADIDKTCKKNGLQSYEVPKDIFLEPEPFSIDTCLTATLKMQRKRAQEYYATQLKAMLDAS